MVLLNADGNEIKNLKVEPGQVTVAGNLETGTISPAGGSESCSVRQFAGRNLIAARVYRAGEK